jgi:4a-hydroxytetrahydrobiopterin dehydratase
MALLDDAAIEQGLQRLPGWERRDQEIVKTFKHRNFVEAVAFVNQVAEIAEAAKHHPDIDIRWSRVSLKLSTHSAGGLTEKDLDVAGRIEEVAAPTS